MGRPKVEVDEILLKKLAKLQLSDNVIADCLGVSVDTLDRRFADKIKAWRSESKGKIAEVLFDEAITKRQAWALKLIAIRHLGYFENQPKENGDNNGAPININLTYSKEKLAKAVTNAKNKK